MTDTSRLADRLVTGHGMTGMIGDRDSIISPSLIGVRDFYTGCYMGFYNDYYSRRFPAATF